jgi:hypothetical protein
MTDRTKPTKASPEIDTPSSGALPSKVHDGLKKEVMTGQRQPKQKRDTRFKKGQSGNLSGRPKKKSTQNDTLVLDTSIDKIILEFANKELTVKSGDKIVTMTGEHALVQSQYKSALNGNVHATKDLLTRTERAENNKKLRQAERADGWREYKTHYSAKLLQMRKLDEEVDENSQLPHPDDVHVSCDNVVSFSGPMEKDQLDRRIEMVQFRDTLILQAELDRRENSKSDDRFITGAELLARLMDNSLPNRMKLPDEEWIDAMGLAYSMTKRTLLKELRTSWNKTRSGKAGNQRGSVRRGTHFPSMEAIKLLYTDLQEYCSNLALSDEPPSQDEVDVLRDIIMSAKAAFAEVNA